MVIFGSLLIIGLLVMGTLFFLGTVSSILRGLIKELRDEREIVGLQKTIMSITAEQISIQKAMIDKRYEMVNNSINTMKLLTERRSDPEWMARFEEGRDNAKYN